MIQMYLLTYHFNQQILDLNVLMAVLDRFLARCQYWHIHLGQKNVLRLGFLLA